MATIQIFSRLVDISSRTLGYIANGEGLPVEHLYLVYTDDNGDKRIIRGGPEESGLVTDTEGPFLGYLNAVEGVYDSSSKDWPVGEDQPVFVTIASGDEADVEQVWNLMKTRAFSITAEQYDYELIPGQNSNTVVGDVVAYAGINMGGTLLTATDYQGLVLPEREGHEVSVPGLLEEFSHDPIDPDSHLLQQQLDGQWALQALGVPAALISSVLGIKTAFAQAQTTASPLVLDLDGDGVELTNLTGADAVYFDLDHNGFAEASGWVGPDDGVLAIDINEDGIVNDGTELFGNQTGYANGFLALSQLDSNTDDVIDSGDALWGDLRVWVDANGNGFTDDGELFTLDELDITEIDLDYGNVSLSDEGNDILQASSFTMDGNTRDIVDAYFAVDLVNTLYDEDFTLDYASLFLPTIRGYGTLPELRIAMSLDNDDGDPDSLISLVTAFATLNASDIFADDTVAMDAVEDIMFRWAGVDGVDPGSRGQFVDAQHLGFLEAMMGQAFLQQGAYANPLGILAGSELEEAFHTAQNALFGRLAAQAAGGELFEGDFFYNIATDSIEGVTALDIGVLDELETTALGLADTPARDAFWMNVVGLIEFTVGTDNLSGGDQTALDDAINDSDGALDLETILADIAFQSVTYSSGTSGNDTYTGNSNNNWYWGLAGDDTITGAGGGDFLEGGSDDDTYVYDGGDGDDTVSDEAGSADRIAFTAGIDVGDLTLTRTSNDDLLIEIDNGVDAAGSILVSGHFTSGGTVEDIRFDDTSTLSLTTQDWTLHGTSGDDTLEGVEYGGDNEDVIYGEGGNDTLDGGTSADTLIGGTGNDVYVVDDAGDVVSENSSAGTDTVQSSITYTLGANVEDLELTGSSAINGTGNASNNRFEGNSGVNILSGGDGNDDLDGNGGADTMIGGAGNDTFVVADAGDVVSENASEGTDLVQAFITYTLGANFENLTLYGTSAINGTGNSLGNSLRGNTGVNILTGADGNDSLDGSVGADTLIGGTGDDTYVIDNASDVVSENASEGTDTIQSGVAHSLASDFENLTLTGTGAVSGTGNSLNNTIVGNSGANILTGAGGNDVLDGGTASDTMIGGSGDDTYVVGASGDVVSENTSEGTDTVQSSITYTLSADLEHLTLTGTSNINGTGNALDNVILGNAGLNTLTGGSGNDTYGVDNTSDVISEGASAGTDLVQSTVSWSLVTNLENLTLTGSSNITGTGNSVVNIITGNAGNNVLDGGADADTMIGGAGNDTFIVDDGSDVVSEGSGAGTDLVQTALTYSLGANLENLALTGASTVNGTGNTLDNAITGNSAVNMLDGGSGNDVLDGGTGADTMIGRAGNDTFAIDNASDLISENASEGTDLVQSSLTHSLAADFENLTLTGSSNVNATGNSSVNTLTGNTGNNILDGGTGADTMMGGAGDDTYVIDDAGDVVSEAASAGTDLVQSGVTWTLAGNFENLTLTGGSNVNAGGNSAANVIAGNTGDNVLTAGTGNDTVSGGSGGDTYVFSDGDGIDVITESAGSADKVIFGASVASGSAVYTRNGSDLEIEYGTGSDSITVTGFFSGAGNQVEEVRFDDATVHDVAYIVYQTQIATSGDDMLYGTSSGGDVIDGLGGHDVIDGGAGADTMIGGTGNDTFVLDHAGDIVSENSAEGTDLVQASVSYTLGSHLENLTLTGSSDLSGTGNAANNTLTGNDGNNVLTGGAGDDSLAGGNGTDTASYAAAAGVVVNLGTGSATGDGTDTLTSIENATGSASVDTLTGSTGANVLDGGAGADTLIGGAGNDTFVVDDASDVVSENSAEGTDLVQSSLTYSLGSNVENLTLTGASAINGTGNASDNVLTGNSDVNVLTGSSGNDVLDGGTAADTMIGGTNNDTYVVDHASDVVSENASEGTDRVQASITYTLGTNLENLTLTGSSNINGTGNTVTNIITGNAGNNVIDGGSGSDSLIGGTGDDTYIVDNASDTITENASEGTDLVQSSVAHSLGSNIENLTLTGASNVSATGNSLVNVLTGNSGNNTLSGGTGADTMIGAAGNDAYVVDDAGDVVSEDASAGTDVVNAGVTYTLGANIERLVLTGSSAINGTGNTLDNTLNGNTGVNILTDDDGNDRLDGDAGADTLIGGAGDDTYTVDDAGDVVSEDASEGTDLVQAFLTYTLGSNVEHVTLFNSTAINATGNSLNNSLRGNTGVNILTGADGNDTLDGNVGADTLIGGTGDDTYVLDNAGDVVSENSSEGTDLVQSEVTHTLGANFENLTLTASGAINGTGTSLNNTITGGSGVNILTGAGGNDYLDGQGGSDTMIGGTGDDTFVVGAAGDVVSENSSEGTDTVISTIAYSLGSDLENLTINSASTLTGTGNSLNNILTGGSGVNTLTGNGGNDVLDGAANADKLLGGTGDDTYVIDNASDTITENSAEGTDLVLAVVTWSLGSNLENLTLTGASGINGTGNGDNNVLIGNAGTNTLNGGSGNDVLDGGSGLDTLTGSTGADTFLFDDTTAYNNIDVITDFNTGQADVLNISDLLTGWSGSITDWVRIQDSGGNSTVEVDRDGTGGGYSWSQIATLSGVTGLTDEATLVTNGNLVVS
jgi:trimeric autotransporter adhesin